MQVHYKWKHDVYYIRLEIQENEWTWQSDLNVIIYSVVKPCTKFVFTILFPVLCSWKPCCSSYFAAQYTIAILAHDKKNIILPVAQGSL